MSGLAKMIGGGAQQQKQRPVSMPDVEDPEALARKRKRALEAQARGGRASTILSGEMQPYSATSLGN